MRDLLAPVGMAFGGITELRNQLYAKEFIRSEKLNRPVVSVGNLTVGGTGKTPVVDAILTQIENQNLRACVLTRGYGRLNLDTSSKIINSESSPLDCGDEPVWLARRHQKSVVVVGADRVASSQLVESPDIYILDDGLQHLRIKRDLDIVLLDCTAPHWHYKPLPWGYGRESFSGIKRSDLVILTRVNQAILEQVENLKNTVKGFGVSKIIESQLAVASCKDIWAGQNKNIIGKKVYLVSGIANPKSFEKSAIDFGAQVVGHDMKADHYIYTQDCIDKVSAQAENLGAEFIVTTEKDGVKIRLLKDRGVPMGELQMKMEFQPQLPGIYDLASQYIR